jgi:hypothetical protein
LASARKARFICWIPITSGYTLPAETPKSSRNFQGVLHNNFSTTAYWNENVYFASSYDNLKIFRFSNGLLTPTWTSESAKMFTIPAQSLLSPPLRRRRPAVFSGSWITALLALAAGSLVRPYCTVNLATDLCNSAEAQNNRDQADNAVKYTVTAIANLPPPPAPGSALVSAPAQLPAAPISRRGYR